MSEVNLLSQTYFNIRHFRTRIIRILYGRPLWTYRVTYNAL